MSSVHTADADRVVSPGEIDLCVAMRCTRSRLAYHRVSSASHCAVARLHFDLPYGNPWSPSEAPRNIPRTGERDSHRREMAAGSHPKTAAADAYDRSHRADQAHPSARDEAPSAASARGADRSSAPRRSGGAGRKQASHRHQGARGLRQNFAGAHVARLAARARRARRVALARRRRRRTRPLPPPSRAGVAACLRQRRRVGDRR